MSQPVKVLTTKLDLHGGPREWGLVDYSLTSTQVLWQ